MVVVEWSVSPVWIFFFILIIFLAVDAEASLAAPHPSVDS